MRASVIWAIMACSLLFSSCKWVKDSGVEGNGVVVEKTFDIVDHRAIKLDVPANVIYTVSDVPSMTVRLDENLMQYVTVSTDSTFYRPLEIGSTRPLRNFKEFTIVLSTSGLSDLNCNHAKSFKMHGTYGIKGGVTMTYLTGVEEVDVDSVETGVLYLTVIGPGNINFRSVKTPYLRLSVSAPGVLISPRRLGPTRMSLSGEVERVKLALTGPGEVDLANLDYKLLEKKSVGPGRVLTGDKRSYKNESVRSPRTSRRSGKDMKQSL